MDTGVADTKDFTLGGTDLESDLYRLALQCAAKLVEGSLGSCKKGDIIIENQIPSLSTEDEEKQRDHESPADASINLEVVRIASFERSSWFHRRCSVNC